LQTKQAIRCLPGTSESSSSWAHIQHINGNFKHYCIAGTLPLSWGGKGSFIALKELVLGANNLSGTLPTEWATALSFQQLVTLHICRCNISGEDASKTVLHAYQVASLCGVASCHGVASLQFEFAVIFVCRSLLASTMIR